MQIKFISEDSKTATYGYKTEYDKLYFHFDKELKTVGISYMRFIRKNNDDDWTTQDKNIKYSCKYGRWQVEPPCLSIEDIEFLHKRTKALWGDSQAEKDDKA